MKESEEILCILNWFQSVCILILVSLTYNFLSFLVNFFLCIIVYDHGVIELLEMIKVCDHFDYGLASILP